MKRSDLTAEQIAFLETPTRFGIGPLYVYDAANRKITDRLGELSLIEPVSGLCVIEQVEGTLSAMRPVYRLTDFGQKVLADQS